MLEPLRVPSFPNIKPLFHLTIDYRPGAKQVRDKLLHVNFTRLLPNVTAMELNEHERRLKTFSTYPITSCKPRLKMKIMKAPDNTKGNTASRIMAVKLSSCTVNQINEVSFYFIFYLFPQAEKFFTCGSLCYSPYFFMRQLRSHIKELTLDYILRSSCTKSRDTCASRGRQNWRLLCIMTVIPDVSSLVVHEVSVFVSAFQPLSNVLIRFYLFYRC